MIPGEIKIFEAVVRSVGMALVAWLLVSSPACETPPREPDAGVKASAVGEECPTSGRTPDLVRFGLVGFWGTGTQVEAFEPMAQFLERHLGVSVDILAASRYDELSEWIREGKVDVALVPPLVYVKAKAGVPCLRLLRTMVVGGAVHYSGYLVVQERSPITSPRDLVGRRVVFVEPSSASGYLFARRWLEKEGIDVHRDLAEVSFLGSHDAVIRAVLSGEADAGATFQGALRRVRRLGLDTASLRILAITGRIPLDALVAVPDLDQGFIESLHVALDQLNTARPEGRVALGRQVDIVGWARTDDRLYDEVRVVMLRPGGPTGEAP